MESSGARKVCTQCSESKPLEDFYVKYKATGQRMARCKACHNAGTLALYRRRRAALPPKPKRIEKPCTRCERVLSIEQFPLKDSKTGYRRAHCHECKIIVTREYKAANQEKVKAGDAAYREAHRGWLRERQRQWRADNPDGYQAIHSRWKSRNKSAVNAATHRRRNQLVGNGGHWTAAEWEALKAEFEHQCLMCGRQEPEIALTVDHIVPVSRGGSNDIGNIQPLCRPCNSLKHRGIVDLRRRE